MTHYRYRALSRSGAVITGVVDAPSEAAAIELVRHSGHYPMSAADESANWKTRLLAILTPARKPAAKEFGFVAEQLAVLLAAGLPLDRAVETVASLADTKNLKAPLGDVLTRVRKGISLADAMSADMTFPKFYLGLVRAGEAGGALEPTLRRLGDYYARSHGIRQTVVSVMTYPTILIGTAAASITVMLVVVLPEFKPLFEASGKPMPIATRLVMQFGDFVANYGWLCGLIAGGASFGLRRMLQRSDFRMRWEKCLLALPIVGRLRVALELERFTRTLGTLIANGVALPQALAIAGDTVTSTTAREGIRATAVGVREGGSLSQCLAQTKVFPTVSLDLIRIGEEAGRLDDMLLRQADMAEKNARYTIDRMLAVLVPGVTLILGFIIAGLIVSMLMAVLSINDLAVQ